MRRSGILLPISSLWSRYGIGSFSKEAYEFIDFLKGAKQKLWQILPLGPTGYGDSPYQSFSTFAGNPYFIDLEQLLQEGLLTKEECKVLEQNDGKINYADLYEKKLPLLRMAYKRKKEKEEPEIKEFEKENSFWIREYALYMAVKDHFQGKSWIYWDEDIKLRKKEALDFYKRELEEEINAYIFQQYYFHIQWKKVKEYANEQGIKIIGDIPIYVSLDSADAWSNPELFFLDEKNIPKAVSGCPPDAFSPTGQLWGNPLYDWQYHKKNGYSWWIERMKKSFQLYDIVRIDHFRGFDEYYSIPYGSDTAIEGHWEKGPGIEIFKCLKEALGEKEIIAEDLGFLTETVIGLVEESGYPGMKVLQFAFDSREESNYFPHHYEKNQVVYTGTHDNDTTRHWFESLSMEDRNMAKEYMRLKEGEEVCEVMITTAFSSVADTCIIPMQDYLNLGEEARMNQPSTIGGNWTWRMTGKENLEELSQRISRLVSLYER